MRLTAWGSLASDDDEALATRTCACGLPATAQVGDLVRCHCGWIWLRLPRNGEGRVVWRLMHVREGAFTYARDRALRHDVNIPA